LVLNQNGLNQAMDLVAEGLKNNSVHSRKRSLFKCTLMRWHKMVENKYMYGLRKKDCGRIGNACRAEIDFVV
jgi:hypothetical protein